MIRTTNINPTFPSVTIATTIVVGFARPARRAFLHGVFEGCAAEGSAGRDGILYVEGCTGGKSFDGGHFGGWQ